MVLGLAEQLIVGGSNARTEKLAEQSADWPALEPSLTVPFTVYEPAESDAVATEAVASEPRTPAPLQV